MLPGNGVRASATSADGFSWRVWTAHGNLKTVNGIIRISGTRPQKQPSLVYRTEVSQLTYVHAIRTSLSDDGGVIADSNMSG